MNEAQWTLIKEYTSTIPNIKGYDKPFGYLGYTEEDNHKRISILKNLIPTITDEHIKLVIKEEKPRFVTKSVQLGAFMGDARQQTLSSSNMKFIVNEVERFCNNKQYKPEDITIHIYSQTYEQDEELVKEFNVEGFYDEVEDQEQFVARALESILITNVTVEKNKYRKAQEILDCMVKIEEYYNEISQTHLS